MIKFEKLPGDILQRFSALKDVLLRDDNVIFAYLFGGLAKGKVMPLSDVDIAVYLSQMEALSEYKMRLFTDITNILGTDEIDLVILNTAPVSISGRVLQNKQVLVDKVPFQRHAYESLTLREFFDFKVKEDLFFKRRYGIG
jgi:uncharacterized protein